MSQSKYHFDSPHSKMKSPALGQSRWTSGFWAERFELCHRTILPSMKKALEDSSNTARLSYFRIAAGLEKGEHKGTNWSDGDCYKWVEAMSHVFGVTRDADLDRQMDDQARASRTRPDEPFFNYGWIGYRHTRAAAHYEPWWLALHGARGASYYATNAIAADRGLSWALVYPTLSLTEFSNAVQEGLTDLRGGCGRSG